MQKQSLVQGVLAHARCMGAYTDLWVWGVGASQGDIADVPLDWDTVILVSLHYKVQENGTNLKASTLCCDTRAPWRKHISASGSGGC